MEWSTGPGSSPDGEGRTEEGPSFAGARDGPGGTREMGPESTCYFFSESFLESTAQAMFSLC